MGRTGRHEELFDLGGAGGTHVIHGRSALGVPQTDIRAGVEQKAHQVSPPELGGIHQGCAAVVVLRTDAGSGLNQNCRDLERSRQFLRLPRLGESSLLDVLNAATHDREARSDHQRRTEFCLGGVDVRSVLHE